MRHLTITLLFLIVLSLHNLLEATCTSPSSDENALSIKEILIDRSHSEIKIIGKNLTKDLLVVLDGKEVMNSKEQDGTIIIKMSDYPGEKELPANVTITLQEASGQLRKSNECTFAFPGHSRVLLGGATGVETRDGGPAAMFLGFYGLWSGSVQQSLPKLHSNGDTMNSGEQFLRRLHALAGVTKIANSEGFGYTAGIGVRLIGDIKLIYGIRFNSDDYPHHILGIAGTINIDEIFARPK